MPENGRLYLPSEMNDTPEFATISLGWNENGLGIAVEVCGKPEPPSGSSAKAHAGDHVKIWVDTRPTGNVHRATEYCHGFACIPADEARDGESSVSVAQIAQQRAERTKADANKLTSRTSLNDNGYLLEVWLPASQIYGFREVSELGKIGFYCNVCDKQLGEQPLSVGDDFPFHFDPSTWLQLELSN